MTTMLYEKEWNEYLERKAHSEYVNSLLPDGSMPKETKIVITTMTELPKRCCDCPCHNSENGTCQAVDEYMSSDWRPFWCPLKELEIDR